MIYGIGNDILDYNRIVKLCLQYPTKFPKRILSIQEYSLFESCIDKPRFVAKRFAYKEAIVKAMGIGLRYGLRFSDFSILPNALGKPIVSYTAKATQVLAELGISRIYVSISDEKEYIFAVAVAEA
jgi:holo-[acyl-carrier protein] synthase